MFLIFIVIIITLLGIHPFLAANYPIDSDILVLEGWISEKAMEEAATIYRKNKYRLVIAVVPDKTSLGGISRIELVKGILVRGRVPENAIITLSSEQQEKGHTRGYALAIKKFIAKDATSILSVNVFTEGTHAKKSYVIYKRVLSPEIRVGIISARPSEYNPAFWWLSLKGWQWVVLDFIKYVRALLISI